MKIYIIKHQDSLRPNIGAFLLNCVIHLSVYISVLIIIYNIKYQRLGCIL